MLLSEGQMSDYKGAALMLDDLPKAQWMLADRGYDAEWFRDALEQKGIKPCIPGRKSRSTPVKYDKRRYKRRNRPNAPHGRGRNDETSPAAVHFALIAHSADP